MNWDLYLLELVNQRLAHPILDALITLITLTAMFSVPIVPSLLWRKSKRQGMTMWIAILVSTLLSVGIQFTLGRSRPTGMRLVMPALSFSSFPSGYAAALFACTTLSALFWPRTRVRACLAAGLASLSQIYLGQHYPSDIVGGIILGTATSLVVYGVFYLPEQDTRPRWAWLLWGQVAVALLATLGAYLDLLHLAFLTLSGMDKLFHFLLPGMLSFFSVGWWAQRSTKVVLGTLAILAIAEEASQSLSAVRSFDLLDLAATLSGILLFGLVSARVGCQRPSELSSQETTT
ncbi:MAG: phosphatase PAP2 family protein [Anaerolineae bacterium]|nr:phosphatase PAP2 family protein [Anaerolineae bacterium]